MCLSKYLRRFSKYLKSRCKASVLVIMPHKPACGLHHVAVNDPNAAVNFCREVLALEPLTPSAAYAKSIRWFDLGRGRALI